MEVSAMKNGYTIGEFSKITGLSVKALRFYHEKGILIPSYVDESSGYRLYDESKIDKARVVMRLREMEFSIEDIAEIFRESEDEADVLDYLERQKKFLQKRIGRDRDVVRSLNQIVEREKLARVLLKRSRFSVEEKSISQMLVAGIRMKGKYSDCGIAFARLGRVVGRYIKGKCLCLYYDGEYCEEDAEFEPCFPVRPAGAGRLQVDGVYVHELPASRCVTLVHKGRYDTLGRSYAQILKYVSDRKLTINLPTREVYVKGPGMIFKGNPNNYLTEIQLPLAA
jgi:DNA-binding transcriptional MerR regulator